MRPSSAPSPPPPPPRWRRRHSNNPFELIGKATLRTSEPDPWPSHNPSHPQTHTGPRTRLTCPVYASKPRASEPGPIPTSNNLVLAQSTHNNRHSRSHPLQFSASIAESSNPTHKAAPEFPCKEPAVVSKPDREVSCPLEWNYKSTSHAQDHELRQLCTQSAQINRLGPKVPRSNWVREQESGSDRQYSRLSCRRT
uniref:Uncharacterized protein n=1 Tax=Opuntia streptacantha TaxID=393608 RepID=A0A7C8ZZM7_OPUST